MTTSITVAFKAAKREILPRESEKLEDFPALAQLVKGIQSRMRGFFTNARKNPDGEPWREESREKGIVVQSSKGKKVAGLKMWRVSWTVPRGADVEQVFRAGMVYSERRKWDTDGMACGTDLKVFPLVHATDADGRALTTQVSIEAFTTHPRGGGLISPRFCMDVRHTTRTYAADGSLAVLESVVTSVDAKHYAALKGVTAAAAASYTRARNHLGGILVRRGDEGPVTAVLGSQTDAGGWLPSGVIDLAMSGSLSDVAKGVTAWAPRAAK